MEVNTALKAAIKIASLILLDINLCTIPYSLVNLVIQGGAMAKFWPLHHYTVNV